MMMDALAKAYQRTNAHIRTVGEDAMQRKMAASDVLSGSSDVGMGGLRGFADQEKQNRRYGMYRGWAYSAIHILATEAAAQAVNVAELINPAANDVEDSERKVLATHKARLFNRMLGQARTKAHNREIRVLDDHLLHNTLEMPNDVQDRWQFVYSFVANLNLTGWAYIIASVVDGKLELFSIPTSWITPKHEGKAFSSFVLHNPKRPEMEGVPLKRENVGFASLPDPSDPLLALAPLTTQILSVQIDDFIQSSQKQFFGNGIFPSVIVTVGKNPHPDVPEGIRPRLTPAQRRQVFHAISSSQAGVDKYGRPAIIDGMIESIVPLSMNQTEMGWDKSEDKIRTRILSAFGVHPFILGEPVGVGGYAQTTKIEERFSSRVNVFLDMIGGAVTRLAGNILQDPSLLVWWDKKEPQDPALRQQLMIAARANGDITQDEFRADMGFPPDEDLNQRTIGKGELPAVVQLLSQVGAGSISPEQAQATLESMGLPTEQALAIAGDGTVQVQELGEAVDDLRGAMKALSMTPVLVDTLDSNRNDNPATEDATTDG